jgi:hypothetical protein
MNATNTAEVISLEDERQKRTAPLATAGSEPPEGPFWLENIPFGWGFLCRQDAKRTGTRTFMASLLQKVNTRGPCVLLWDNTSGTHFWVVMKDFSLANEWLESIPVVPSEPEEAPTPEEITDGTVDRADST